MGSSSGRTAGHTLSRGMRVYRIFMLLVLIAGVIYQSYVLFTHWRSIPKKDLSAWRLEYADINFEGTAPVLASDSAETSVESHQLEMQLVVHAPVAYPFLEKNIALPSLELLLSNVDGDPLAYQTLAPKDWLGDDPATKDYLTRGAPSQTQITVKIPLELPATASGFQLQMVYPN